MTNIEAFEAAYRAALLREQAWREREEKIAQESAHMVETLRLRTAALHRVQRSNDDLRRECLDREATEQDVRARLADAEKALSRVRAVADHIRAAPAETWGEPLTVPANAESAFMRGADSAINFATKAISAALDGSRDEG